MQPSPQIREEIPTNQQTNRRTDFRKNRFPVPWISVPGPKHTFLWVALSLESCGNPKYLAIFEKTFRLSACTCKPPPPPKFGEEIPTIPQNNSAGLFFSEMLPSHQDYGPGPPNTLSLWLLCCQRHVETLIS